MAAGLPADLTTDLAAGLATDLTAGLAADLSTGLIAGLTDCLDGFIGLVGVADFFAVALVDTGECLTAFLTLVLTVGFADGFAFLGNGFAAVLAVTGFLAGLATAFAAGFVAVDLRIAAAVLATTLISERLGFATCLAGVLAIGLAAVLVAALAGFLIGVRADFGMAILWR